MSYSTVYVVYLIKMSQEIDSPAFGVSEILTKVNKKVELKCSMKTDRSTTQNVMFTEWKWNCIF
jgi:hypothetical protein